MRPWLPGSTNGKSANGEPLIELDAPIASDVRAQTEYVDFQDA